MKKLMLGFVNDKNERKILAFFIGIFLLGMFFLSASSSPLYPYAWGGDSAIFMLIGKGIANGKLPYVDLFDHKGPVLFFIEALGYGIAGRVGVFLMQCVFGCVNLIFLYKAYKLLRVETEKKTIMDIVLVFALAYSTYFFTFEGGNLTEEFSLPFISGCLYLMVKYAMHCKEEDAHPRRYSLCYGICLGILAFIRINNAVSICAGVLAIAIYLTYKKRYKNLFENILFGILGVLIVVIPIVLYFAAKSALYDMIYATFIYNFKYVGNIGRRTIIEFPLKYIVLYLPMLITGVLILFHQVKRKEKPRFEAEDFVLLVVCLFNVFHLIISNSYAHYFTIYMPVFFFVLCKYWSFQKKDMKNVLIIICLIGNFYYVARYGGATVRDNFVTKENYRRYRAVNHVMDVVPEIERDSVIAYNLSAQYYMYADIIPCYKYYMYQEWWSVNDPSVKKDFVKFLKEDKPKWILVFTAEVDEEVCGILKENYELKKSNVLLSTYRVKE